MNTARGPSTPATVAAAGPAPLGAQPVDADVLPTQPAALATPAAATPRQRRPAGPVRLLLTPWLVVLLLWLGVISVVWNLIALALLWLPAPLGQRIGRAGISLGYRFYWLCGRASGLMRLDASALDMLRDEPGGLIVAANHPSMLDAMMLVARLPRGVCVMKAGLMHNPLLGAAAKLARYIPNDDPVTLIRRSTACLREGGQLVLFPEGTRTESAPINRLLPGLGRIAQRAGVPVQTVLIETDSPYLGKGWPLWRLPPLPIVFRARLGQRFCVESYTPPGGGPRAATNALMADLDAYFRRELRR
jgi:1-acyl-sn-glycerol-3-phosphate acyltransferase